MVDRSVWLLVLMSACSGSKSEPRPDPAAGASDATVPVAQTDAGVAAAAETSTIAGLPSVADLGPLDAAGVPARYRVGTELLAKGALPRALAVLRQIRDLGCTPCRQHLDRARTDAAWGSAWTDERFQLLTMSADGPLARIVGFGVVGDASGVVASIELDRLPGYARIPALELVVRDHRGEISRTKIDLDQGDSVPVAIDRVGRYVVELRADGKLAGSQRVIAGMVACAGGGKKLIVRGQVAARLGIEYADQVGGPVESLFLEIRRWVSLDTTDSYRVEWRRNGALVKREKSSDGPSWLSDSDGNSADWHRHFEKRAAFDGCGWQLRTEHYVAPAQARRLSGRWELRVYRHGLPGVSVTFTARRGAALTALLPTETHIPTPPAIAAELEKEHGRGRSSADGALIRAMGRSAELIGLQAEQNRKAKAGRRDTALQKRIDALVATHGGAWGQADWPIAPTVPLPTIRPSTFAPKQLVGRFPLIAKDGSVFVASVQEHLVEPSMQCKSAAVRRVRFFRVGAGEEMEPIGSRKLDGYLRARCGAIAVYGQVRVVRKKTELGMSFSFLDRSGKQLTTTEVEDPEKGTICAVPGHRIAFLKVTDASDKCASAPRVQFVPVRY